MNHLSWPKLLANVFSCSISHCDTVLCVYAWVTSRRINIVFTASGIVSTNDLTRKIVFGVCQNQNKKSKEKSNERRETWTGKERESASERQRIILWNQCNSTWNLFVFILSYNVKSIYIPCFRRYFHCWIRVVVVKIARSTVNFGTCLDICVNVFVLFCNSFCVPSYSPSAVITLPIPFATTILRRHHHSTRMCSRENL